MATLFSVTVSGNLRIKKNRNEKKLSYFISDNIMDNISSCFYLFGFYE
jgi:hypothetical protein